MATHEQELYMVHHKSVARIPSTQQGSTPQPHRQVITGANFAAQSQTRINTVNANTMPRETLANNGGLHRIAANSYDVNVQHALSTVAPEAKAIKKQGGA